MNIAELHFEVKFRANKLDTQVLRDLPPAHIDRALNAATIEFVEGFYSGRSILAQNMGFEVTQQRTDMLSTLVVKNPEQPDLAPVNFDATLNAYEVPFSNLVFPYVHILRVYVFTDCDGVSLTNVQLVQHDDLNVVLIDPLRKPSLKWRRCIGAIGKTNNNIGESSLYVYTDGQYAVTSVRIEYIKKPVVVYYGGYNSLDGLYVVGDPQVNSDLPEHYHSLLVDMTVQNLYRTLLVEQGVQINTKPV